MHQTIEPAILYFGTPVVLVSTLNEDGSPNLAPMSSAWWLGWRAVLGFGASSRTPQNMMRTRQCVLNLPSADMVAAVNRLARLTGSNPVPEGKLRKGCRHKADKFKAAGLTAVPAETVDAPCVRECPVQLEAMVDAVYGLAVDDAKWRGRLLSFEVRITRVHVDAYLLVPGDRDRIDPDRWRPLIMSFQQFYGLTPDRLHDSTLARISEELYRVS